MTNLCCHLSAAASDLVPTSCSKTCSLCSSYFPTNSVQLEIGKARFISFALAAVSDLRAQPRSSSVLQSGKYSSPGVICSSKLQTHTDYRARPTSPAVQHTYVCDLGKGPSFIHEITSSLIINPSDSCINQHQQLQPARRAFRPSSHARNSVPHSALLYCTRTPNQHIQPTVQPAHSTPQLGICPGRVFSAFSTIAPSDPQQSAAHR